MAVMDTDECFLITKINTEDIIAVYRELRIETQVVNKS